MSMMRMSLCVAVLAGVAVFGVHAEEAKDNATVKKPRVEKPLPKPEEAVQGTANGKQDDPHSWWRGNYERISRDIKKMDGEIDIAFVGDSITARWGGENWQKHWGSYKAVNMGIGGDQTQNVLWRLQNGHLDGYKARLFVVMIGTNNLWDKRAEPEDVARGVKAILDLTREKQPGAKILLLSIFPTGEKPNPGRDKRAAVNELLPKLADGNVVHYMDIYGKFLEEGGTISKAVMHDFLHLGSGGYDIWAAAIGGKVKELLGESSSGQ